jgi:hypothetical protein
MVELVIHTKPGWHPAIHIKEKLGETILIKAKHSRGERKESHVESRM